MVKGKRNNKPDCSIVRLSYGAREPQEDTEGTARGCWEPREVCWRPREVCWRPRVVPEGMKAVLRLRLEGKLLLGWWEDRPQRWVSRNIETLPERSLLVPKSAA